MSTFLLFHPLLETAETSPVYTKSSYLFSGWVSAWTCSSSYETAFNFWNDMQTTRQHYPSTCNKHFHLCYTVFKVLVLPNPPTLSSSSSPSAARGSYQRIIQKTCQEACCWLLGTSTTFGSSSINLPGLLQAKLYVPGQTPSLVDHSRFLTF